MYILINSKHLYFYKKSTGNLLVMNPDSACLQSFSHRLFEHFSSLLTIPIPFHRLSEYFFAPLTAVTPLFPPQVSSLVLRP